MKKSEWFDGKKICPGCKTTKEAGEYYNLTAKRDGKMSRCKTCVDSVNKEWQTANPEKFSESQRKWRTANEGYTYLEETSGYVMYVGYGHPATTPSGLTKYHRVVLWDKIGPGDHECYWNCGKTVSWDKSYPKDSDGLVVDHLNGDRDDNRPENLVPSCASCNAGVSRLSRKVSVTCSYGECAKNSVSKGLCPGHYAQQRQGRELKPLRRKLVAA